jgi:cytochrome P450
MGRPLVSGPTQVRNAVRFGRDPLGLLDDLRGGSSGLVNARFAVGPTLTFVDDPALVRQVLVDDHDRYWRPDILSSRTEALTRNGLIQSDGALWRRQRAWLHPLFGVDRLMGYADTIATVSDDVVGSWDEGREVDLYREMARITVRVIARELLGTGLDTDDVERVLRTSDAVAREFTVSPSALVRQFLPTPPSREYRTAIDEMHAWADSLIAETRQAENGDDDGRESLITVMLDAERDPETDLEPNLIRDEVLTFLFAGYETTALTLSFALWFVSRRPALATALREEAQSASRGGQLGWSDLPDLELAERVVREALRLRPASWGIFREARVDSTLGGERVAEGDFLMLPQWTLHRDARFFDDPTTFDPDRWRTLDPNGTPAYFPFGAGPQSCIDGRLGTTEATLVLARVCRAFDLETTTRAVDDLRPAGVLQPRHGVPARPTRP